MYIMHCIIQIYLGSKFCSSISVTVPGCYIGELSTRMFNVCSSTYIVMLLDALVLPLLLVGTATYMVHTQFLLTAFYTFTA
jgi:hypothetical protein